MLLLLFLLQLSEGELLMLQQVADADMDGAISLEVRRGGRAAWAPAAEKGWSLHLRGTSAVQGSHAAPVLQPAMLQQVPVGRVAWRPASSAAKRADKLNMTSSLLLQDFRVVFNRQQAAVAAAPAAAASPQSPPHTAEST
jgi:hypothetical protein